MLLFFEQRSLQRDVLREANSAEQYWFQFCLFIHEMSRTAKKDSVLTDVHVSAIVLIDSTSLICALAFFLVILLAISLLERKYRTIIVRHVWHKHWKRLNMTILYILYISVDLSSCFTNSTKPSSSTTEKGCESLTIMLIAKTGFIKFFFNRKCKIIGIRGGQLKVVHSCER